MVLKNLIVLLVMIYPFCAQSQQYNYSKIVPGNLKGKLLVQWLEPDQFLFIPDKENPLTFVRGNGEKITPGRMMTDGGSVPRPIWILRNYSPWGFAPAFIVHDWLFRMRQCKLAGYQNYSLDSSGIIMAEIMKTMIEAKKVEANSLVVDSMYMAVTSGVARDRWERGTCEPIPPAMFPVKPLSEYILEF
jgi:hypothetical protein